MGSLFRWGMAVTAQFFLQELLVHHPLKARLWFQKYLQVLISLFKPTIGGAA
jgi:hypothetical protein